MVSRGSILPPQGSGVDTNAHGHAPARRKPESCGAICAFLPTGPAPPSASPAFTSAEAGSNELPSARLGQPGGPRIRGRLIAIAAIAAVVIVVSVIAVVAVVVVPAAVVAPHALVAPAIVMVAA